MDAGHDYLLPASTNFDQMRRAVRRQQVALDPTERLVCAQRDSTFRRQADADKDLPLIFQIKPRRGLDNVPFSTIAVRISSGVMPIGSKPSVRREYSLGVIEKLGVVIVSPILVQCFRDDVVPTTPLQPLIMPCD